MSGKQSKKERKALREAQREALRKQERQRTIFTIIVIAVVVSIGGVLVYVSLDDTSPEDEVADLPEDFETEPETEEVVLEDQPVACGAEMPAGADAERPTYDAPEQVLEEGIDHQAVIETSCGRIVVDLDSERSPAAVNSFVFLAQERFFDGLLIFRNATSIGALQTGSGTDDAGWQVGYTLTDELEAAEEDGYPPGTLAMANAGPDTAGSQFFMVYSEAFADGVEQGVLQPAYAPFGMVIEGLDVLEQIGAIPTGGQAGETPLERIYIESVTIAPAGATGPAEVEEPTEPPTG